MGISGLLKLSCGQGVGGEVEEFSSVEGICLGSSLFLGRLLGCLGSPMHTFTQVHATLDLDRF